MFKSGLQHTRLIFKVPFLPLLHPIHSMRFSIKQTNRKYERRCAKAWAKTTMIRFTYGWCKKSCSSWYGKYWVLYVPGGAGFLPSTVCLCYASTNPGPITCKGGLEEWLGEKSISSRSCLLLFFCHRCFHLKFVLGGGFIFLILTLTWGDHPIWLISFRWVETNN